MLLTHAALLSCDSLVAGCAFGPLLTGVSQRLAGAVVFGLADGGGSVLGGLLATARHGLLAGVPALPAVYAVYLVIVIGLARRRLQVAGPAREGWGVPAIVGLVAAALAVDNLVSATPGAAASVPAMAAMSASLALLGLTAGGWIASGWPDRPRRIWLDAGLALAVCLALLT